MDLDKVQSLRLLTSAERSAAYEKAKRNLLVKIKPNFNSMQANEMSEYPKILIGIVGTLIFFALFVSFLTSSFRLYAIGSETFCDTWQDKPVVFCYVAGSAMVLLAETGQVLFLVALALWAVENVVRERILYALVFLSTGISLIGNLEFVKPWQTQSIFVWFETVGPPLIVMGLGYLIKEITLATLHKRHIINAKLRLANIEYANFEDDITTHAKWGNYYSVALKEALQKAHQSKNPWVLQLTAKEVAYLVYREMQEDLWTVDPNQGNELVQLEKMQEQLETQTVAKEVAKLEAVVVPTKIDQTEIWFDNDVQGYRARAADGYEMPKIYASEGAASAGLKLREHHKRKGN